MSSDMFGGTSGSGAHYGRAVGLCFIFVWFALGGLGHFVATQGEMQVVPPWVPWPREAVLLSGVFEWLGAAGLLWRPTRRAAGIGLFMLTLAVTPVHFYMLSQASLFNVPYWALWLRLPLQVALLVLIGWSTRTPGRRSTARPIPTRTT